MRVEKRSSASVRVTPTKITKPPSRPPSLRTKRGKGTVSLRDRATGERREYWLGPCDEASTREAYHRLIAQWEATDRRLPQHPLDSARELGASPSAITLGELLIAYFDHAKCTYTASEVTSIRSALRVTRAHFGSIAATEFGPAKLRLVRDAMIAGDDHTTPPRVPWSRPTTNRQVQRITAMFKWAAALELLPVTIYQQLKCLPPLRRGLTTAAESTPVKPVALHAIERVAPLVSRQVAALMNLQLLTAARGCELFGLRPRDLDRSVLDGVWTVQLTHHKTAHHGKQRTLLLGPQGQALLAEFLVDRADDAFLFSPREAEAERRSAQHARRKTPLSCGNRPGTNRSAQRTRALGECYNRMSYHHAIARACRKAFPPPAEVIERGEDSVAAWHRDHHWHPHQLRHTAGTRIRKSFGLEAAAVALGHASARVTDAVYAERDMDRAAEVMRKLG